MADGFQPLTVAQIQTPDGISQLNNIIQILYNNMAGDGVNVSTFYGVGSPEGFVTAGIGSIYLRTDGSTNTSLYRKESGLGNTGWVATSNITVPISVANGGTGSDNSATAQGTVPYFSATGVISGLAPGTAGQFLQTQGVGSSPIWASAGSILISNTILSSVVTSGSIAVSDGNNYFVIVNITNLSSTDTLILRFNSDTSSNYKYYLNGSNFAGTAITGNSNSNTAINISKGIVGSSVVEGYCGNFYIGTPVAGGKLYYVSGQAVYNDNTTSNQGIISFGGRWGNTTNITSFSIQTSGGSVTMSGNVALYKILTS